MLGFLSSHNVNPNKLRGQAYDGAGNMSGKTNGAAALTSSQFPLALSLPLLLFSFFKSFCS